jgi:hypothetical protein
MATIKEMFTANAADIFEATELLKVLGDREGQFVWKQLAAEGGEFVAYVTADDENSYPNGGMQDGYWYELVKEGIPYTGVNPLTIGEAGATIPANTLLEEALQILNGVEAGVDLSISGYSKMAVDYITFSSRLSAIMNGVTHSLGVTPKMGLLMARKNLLSVEIGGNASIFHALVSRAGGGQDTCMKSAITYRTGNGYEYYDRTYTGAETVKTPSSTMLYFLPSSFHPTLYYASGVEYILITWA